MPILCVIARKLPLGALQRLAADPEEAAVMGKVARAGAIERFGLARFLADWDSLLSEVLR